MKKRTILFSLAILGSVFLMSCMVGITQEVIHGTGEVVKQERELSEFDGILAAEGIQVYVAQGNTESVVVEASENFMDYIVTEKSDGKLKIHIEDGYNLRKGTKNVYVTIKDVTVLKASSGAAIEGQGKISGNSLKVRASSGADIRAEIEYELTKSDASSGAHIKLKGTAKDFSAEASSGADITATEVDGETFNGDVSSGANITVGTFNAIDAEASSGGSIKYKGKPAQVNVQKSSGGSVSAS